jgi:hypothetical protein
MNKFKDDFSDIFESNRFQPDRFQSERIEPEQNKQEQNEQERIDTSMNFIGDIFNVHEIPTSTNWYYPPLYLDNINEILVWQIGYNNRQIKVISGNLSNNTITNSDPIIINNTIKNTDPIKTVRSLYIDRSKMGYSSPYNEYDVIKPMLAKNYHHPSSNDQTKNKVKINKWPVAVMRNINGIRVLARLSGKQVILRSKLNSHFSNLNNIKEDLYNFLHYLPSGTELDGELYSLEISYSQLKSQISRNRLKNTITFWIYDIIELARLSWEDRYKILIDAYTRYLEDDNRPINFKIMQSYSCNSPEQLDQYHAAFVAEGYEGVVIRRYGSVDKSLSTYRSGKTNSLVEYKSFNDEVVVISNINKDGNNILVKDKRSNIFPIRSRFDITQLKLGDNVVIRYQDVDENELPKYPVAIYRV